MVQGRQPRVGDYWCMGLLTDDLLEAVQHAHRWALEHDEEVAVSRYKEIWFHAPLMEDAAVIRKPSAFSDHVVASDGA